MLRCTTSISGYGLLSFPSARGSWLCQRFLGVPGLMAAVASPDRAGY